MIRADLLILLSDVDGLYSADPARDREARHIPRVEEITDEIESLAGGAVAGGAGTGGMRTKLAAARIARACGRATIIASGRDERPIARSEESRVGKEGCCAGRMRGSRSYIKKKK